MLTWAGAATCYVWDSQHAGRFIRAALMEAEEIDNQLVAAAVANPSVAALHPAVYSRRQIHFAACGAHEVLPRVTGMPDDLFTACLVTPLRIALLHHNLQTFPLTTRDTTRQVQRSHGYMAALLNFMSQELKDRLWGELQAILHTIAWQSLDGPTYQMLFGSSGDVVSSFASGFLLAQRVMGAYRANPESIPAIPCSTSHTFRGYDLRNTKMPKSTSLVHPEGIASASFQAHSGLMSTVGKLASSSYLSTSVNVSWGIHRCSLGRLSTVSTETFRLDLPVSIGSGHPIPYTTMHPLRPFLGVGYGNQCVLRGSGVGKGDDTDSGSFSFLSKQRAVESM